MDTLTRFNFEAAWDAASRDLRKHGIRVRRNVMGCCRSCVWAEFPEDHGPIIWHYGGQGARITFNHRGEVADSEVDVIWLQHGEIADTPLESVVRETYAKHGIALEWPEKKSEMRAIGLVVKN